MKKKIALFIALGLTVAMTACGTAAEQPAENQDSQEQTEETAEETTEETAEETADETTDETADDAAVDADANQADAAVMTYAEYVAADLDTEVTIETYVQAKQSWWEDKATVYTQDEDGAYFLYNMACSEEDYEKLTVGTKIKVTGYKSEWSGEVEIVDATFEIEEGNFVATPLDVTDKLASEDLIDYQNLFVEFKDMTVEAANDDGDAFMYSWDGSGSDGDDLYFNVSKDGETYTFTVESYLTGAGTDVYEAVKALNVGDTVDMEGFLYWYEGVNPHITAVTVK